MGNSNNISKIIISSDDFNGQVDRGYLSLVDKDMRAIIAGMKSAVNPSSYFSVRQKSIDSRSGKLEFEVYVSSNEAKNALQAGNYIAGTLHGNLENSVAYSFTNPRKTNYTTGTITLHGSEAQRQAKEALSAQGGSLIHDATASEPDRYSYILPVPKGTNPELYSSGVLSEANKSSVLIANKQYEAQINKQNASFAKEKEIKDKKDKEKQEENKNEIKSNFLKVVSILTIISDVTRRILSSVAERASQVVADTREAGNYMLSYKQARDFKVQELALGLKSGTNMGAIADLQSKFGNITSLDEGALDALAVVMGSGVSDMVKSGLGGKDPEALKNAILNAFSSKALAGYNSVGEYVGQEQARRELVEYLKKISPNLSELLSVFLEKKNNPNSIYNNANSYEDLMNMVTSNRMSILPIDFDSFYTFGENVDKLKTAIESIKEGIQVKLSDKLEKALTSLADDRTFMDEGASLEQDAKNYNSLIAYQEKLLQRKEDINNRTLDSSFNWGDLLTEAQQTNPMLKEIARDNARGNKITNDQWKALGLDGKKNKDIRAKILKLLPDYYATLSLDNYMDAYIIEAINYYLKQIDKQFDNADKGEDVHPVYATEANIKQRALKLLTEKVLEETDFDLLPKEIQDYVADREGGFFSTKLGENAKKEYFETDEAKDYVDKYIKEWERLHPNAPDSARDAEIDRLKNQYLWGAYDKYRRNVINSYRQKYGESDLNPSASGAMTTTIDILMNGTPLQRLEYDLRNGTRIDGAGDNIKIDTANMQLLNLG